MATSVNEYRIYCVDETTFKTTYGTTPPTTCPTNTAHTVNPNSISIVSTISNSKVEVKEEDTPTGGHFQMKSMVCTCPVGQSIHDFTWPMPISALSFYYNVSTELTGDTFQLLMMPNTTLGTLIADVNVSDVTFTVSQTVIDNMKIGFTCILTDGVNSDDCGRVIAINTNLNTVTCETATTHAFLATSPTLVQFTAKPVDFFQFGNPGPVVVGCSKIGGSYLPAGKIVRLIYNNNGIVEHTFIPNLEYLY